MRVAVKRAMIPSHCEFASRARVSTKYALRSAQAELAGRDHRQLVGSGAASLRCRKHCYILSFHGRALIERKRQRVLSI
jgi:hypothetical protein